MNSNIRNFDFEFCSNKEKVFEHYCKYTFTRTQSMFVYEGLPDTIPAQWLECYLQRNGACCIAEVNGKLYALLGNAGGELDEYYQPTTYTVANPALKLSETYEIGKNCVYARNDYSAIGLVPLISRYCGLMTENCLTVRLTDINMRMMNLLSAPDDNTYQSSLQYMKDLENGKLGVIGETPFFDGIKLQSKGVGNGDYMIQFIELQQYLKGSMYNELGINANFNMKREALSGQEVALNDDALMPLIDDMLKQRRTMCDQLNEMFGLNVSVDYGSTWHSNVIEKQLVGQSEFNANESGSEEFAGDEASLPDDKDANSVDEDATQSDDVSQLNEKESDTDDNGEISSSSDDVGETEKSDNGSSDDELSTQGTDNSDNTSDNSDEKSDEDVSRLNDDQGDAEDIGESSEDSNDEDSREDEPSDNEPNAESREPKGESIEDTGEGSDVGKEREEEEDEDE